MENIRIFDTPGDVRTYMQKRKVKLIGYGEEGYAYLDRDNYVLKEINDKYIVPYDKSIITTATFNLKSFIFPEELYIANDLIYGYKARFFENDLFCDMYRKEKVEIDLEKLLKARLRVIEDLKVLTTARYGIDDAYGNILFNGEELAFIDTLCYVKDDSSLDNNIKILDRSLNFTLNKIDENVAKVNMPFENKVKFLIRKNRSTKVEVKPMSY